MSKTNAIGNFPVPEGLSERSRRILGKVVPKNCRSTGRITILEEALRALDQADRVREVLELEGMRTKTEKTGTVHLHPLCRVETECRAFFFKCWSRLGLVFDPLTD
jgi:hypothetical protein